MIRRLLAAVVTLAFAAVLLVACWPQLFGVERVFGVAQLVSLRGTALLVTLAVGILLLIIALVWRDARRFFASLGVIALAFSLVTAGVLAVRGTGATDPAAAQDDDIVVLSWNTLGDAPGMHAIATLAREKGADIVVLPETSAEAASDVARLLDDAGMPMQLVGKQYGTEVKARSTMMLIAEHLGEYRRDDSAGDSPGLPSVVATPVDGAGPTIVGAHPIAPVPGEMQRWSDGLDWLAARCNDTPGEVILAGDLNSTLDHWASFGSDVGLGRCADAARATGNGAVGTWPVKLPALLGSPIDHVLSTSGWTAVSFAVVESRDATGSDHRPVVARLRAAS